MIDVLIAGAGPAGCATALMCARRGLRVLLLDRARFPRDKACGEGLLPSGVAALAQLGLDPPAFAFRLEGVGFIADEEGGPAVWARFGEGTGRPTYGLGVRRREFDAMLLAAARAQPGVTVQERTTVLAPLWEQGRVVGLATDRGPHLARVVVAADGLRSHLRDQLGLARPARGPARLGLRLHLEVRRLPFGPRVAVLVGGPVEYYLTPLGTHTLQVAVLGERHAFARAGLAAATLLDRLRDHPRLGHLLAGAAAIDRPLGAGPLRQRVRGVVCEGALLVGDAAGYLDAITGEGMGAALRGGLAAGEVLARALADSGAVASLPSLEPYARAHHALVRRADRLTARVLFLARHPRLARAAIAALGRRPAVLSRRLAALGRVS